MSLLGINVYSIYFIKTFHIVEELRLFSHILVSALPRSVKLAFGKSIGWILSASIRVRKKNIIVFLSFPEEFESQIHILATALLRSNKPEFFQFLCLDIVNINMHIKCYQTIPYGWRPTAISIYSRIASALIWSKKCDIWQAFLLHLAGIYQYVKTYEKNPKGLSALSFFAIWSRTDRRINRICRALFERQIFNRSTFLRVTQFLC